MSPTKQLETTEQVVAAMGDVRRMRILEILTERQASVKELSEMIHESPQTTHYHTKMLERAGLIEIVEKREVRGALEKFYRAVADRFVAGDIVGKASSEFGVGLIQNFLDMLRYSAESTNGEGVSLHVLGIQCAPERIPEFQERLQELAREFQGMSGDEGKHFGLIAGVFPIPEDALASLPEHPNRILTVEGMDFAE
ncbi:winged helix-turn-helix domain-containing protein [bacterium]|nr:winged helix-turn-helix domain-containing protein [bacterium]